MRAGCGFWYKASFTIEASILLSFLMFLLVYSIGIGEWIYNRYALEAATITDVEYAKNAWMKDENTADARLREYAKQQTEGILLGKTDLAVLSECKKSGTIQLKYCMYMNPPLPKYLLEAGILPFGEIRIEGEGKAKRPNEQIRRIKLIGEIIE